MKNNNLIDYKRAKLWNTQTLKEMLASERTIIERVGDYIFVCNGYYAMSIENKDCMLATNSTNRLGTILKGYNDSDYSVTSVNVTDRIRNTENGEVICITFKTAKGETCERWYNKKWFDMINKMGYAEIVTSDRGNIVEPLLWLENNQVVAILLPVRVKEGE